MTNKEYIDAALNRDVNLTVANYAEKQIESDKATSAHGIEGKAPISEATRHKRIQSNYYGTSLNVMLSLLAELSQTNELLRSLLLMQHVCMSSAQKAQYDEIIKQKSNI